MQVLVRRSVYVVESTVASAPVHTASSPTRQGPQPLIDSRFLVAQLFFKRCFQLQKLCLSLRQADDFRQGMGLLPEEKQ
jgi:hypothetical protein